MKLSQIVQQLQHALTANGDGEVGVEINRYPWKALTQVANLMVRADLTDEDPPRQRFTLEFNGK